MSKKPVEIEFKETVRKEIVIPNISNEKHIILFGEKKLLKPIKELFKNNGNDDRWYVFSHNTLFILDDKSSLECVGGYYNLECSSFDDEESADIVVEKKEPIDPITVNIEINSFNLSNIYNNILILNNSKINTQYIDVIGYNNIKDSNLAVNDLTIKGSNVNKSVLKVGTNCNIIENLLENVDINVRSFNSIKSNLHNGYLSGNNCTLRNSSIHNNEYSKFYITNCKDIEIVGTTLNHHQYTNPTGTCLFKDATADYKSTSNVLITSWFDTGHFNGLSSVPFIRTGKASLGIGRYNIHIDDFTTYYNNVRNKIVDALPKNNPLVGNISPVPYSYNNQFGLIPYTKPLDEKVINFGEEQLVRLATANRYSKLDYNDTLLLRIYLSFIDQIASRLSLFPLLDSPLKK